jgi:hypothetical protein
MNMNEGENKNIIRRPSVEIELDPKSRLDDDYPNAYTALDQLVGDFINQTSADALPLLKQNMREPILNYEEHLRRRRARHHQEEAATPDETTQLVLRASDLERADKVNKQVAVCNTARQAFVDRYDAVDSEIRTAGSAAVESKQALADSTHALKAELEKLHAIVTANDTAAFEETRRQLRETATGLRVPERVSLRERIRLEGGLDPDFVNAFNQYMQMLQLVDDPELFPTEEVQRILNIGIPRYNLHIVERGQRHGSSAETTNFLIALADPERVKLLNRQVDICNFVRRRCLEAFQGNMPEDQQRRMLGFFGEQLEKLRKILRGED